MTDNVDLQVRYKWLKYDDDPTAHDVAVWDNHSSIHSATDDYFELGGQRVGDRAVSLGEKPYYDPKSRSRREALGHPAWGGQPDHEQLLKELRGW